MREKKKHTKKCTKLRNCIYIYGNNGMKEAQKTTLAPSHGNEGNKGVLQEIQQRAGVLGEQ